MNLGKLLDELGQIGSGGIDDGAVVINVARELKILRFPEGATPAFMRIVDRHKGEGDFGNLEFLGARMGDLINRPSRIVATDDLVCGIFPYIANRKATYKGLMAHKLLPRVGEALTLMHESGRDFVAAGRAQPARSVSYAGSHKDASDFAFSTYLETTFRAIAEVQAQVAQHCDFTYANLGITSVGRLVVFDWEEFGAVQYPGFDLATFLLSHHHHAGTAGEALESPEGLKAWIDRGFGLPLLGRLGLTLEEFTGLFPAYLYLFLTLKQVGFGAAINRRMQSMWQRIMQSDAWMRVMLPRGA